MPEKVLLTWSGGKDSALALYEIQKNYGFEVVALLTTITEYYNRISMHGVRRELLEIQAEALRCPLDTVYISKKLSIEEYEERMKEKLMHYKSQGVLNVIFGDIFLEDVRKYREENLAKVGMNGVFPLWRRNTKKLAKKFVEAGFKAVVSCVDKECLDESFAGRTIDAQFLADLPEECDPCGENGEYHSFVYDGSIFKKPIQLEIGDIVLRENRFYYCDLSPL